MPASPRLIARQPAILRTPAALAIIVGSYLLFFVHGIIAAIETLHLPPLAPTDFSNLQIWPILGRLAGQILGACVLLYLLCRWLGVDRALAGLPRRGATPLPSLLTTAAAGAGLIVSSVIFAVLQHADRNALAGGAVPNGWATPGEALYDLNAGVVEEIVVVAIPVLVGLAAGWSPLRIVAISAFLRWPFHIYHCSWPSLPWALIWGGAMTCAYLYLRRLAPLIVYHFVDDYLADLGAIVNTTVSVGFVLAPYLALMAYFGIKTVTDRRTTTATTQVNPAAATLIARRDAADATRARIVGGGFMVAAATSSWLAARHGGSLTGWIAVVAGVAAVTPLLVIGCWRVIHVRPSLRAYPLRSDEATGTGSYLLAVSSVSHYPGMTRLHLRRLGPEHPAPATSSPPSKSSRRLPVNRSSSTSLPRSTGPWSTGWASPAGGRSRAPAHHSRPSRAPPPHAGTTTAHHLKPHTGRLSVSGATVRGTQPISPGKG